MIIYLVENKTNGKCYVGQTTGPLSRRWTKHASEAGLFRGCPVLSAAIRKYGIANFYTRVIANASCIGELNALEEHYVKKNKTLVPNGYNVSPGGFNRTVSDRTRRKLSISSKRAWACGRQRLTPAREAALSATRAKCIKICPHGISPVVDCKDCRNFRNRLSNLRHPGRRKKLARDRYLRDKREGFCTRCSAIAIPGRVHCSVHTEKNRLKRLAVYP